MENIAFQWNDSEETADSDVFFSLSMFMCVSPINLDICVHNGRGFLSESIS